MTASLRFGRIAGIPVGASWSALLIAGLIAWSLAGRLLPAQAPGLTPGTPAARSKPATTAKAASKSATTSRAKATSAGSGAAKPSTRTRTGGSSSRSTASSPSTRRKKDSGGSG